ncbi:MAG: HEPN domain-containing protein [Coprothermobacterota bacterium]|nr:HEPN domain-containing protein [Coprothermobacterota bacterium]
MVPSDEARQMLAAATKDWRALAGMVDPDVFADEIFGFHAQQAAEKALKAWLSLLGVAYPQTHDLSLLIGMLRQQGQDEEGLYDLIEFNPYAVQYRYEAFDEMGGQLDRDAVNDRVATLLRQVETMIAIASK